MKLLWGIATLAAMSISAAAAASDTVTYIYDAKGRLVRVQHSGGPAAGVDKQYTYDKADSRQRVLVTGGAAALLAAVDTEPAELSGPPSDN